MKITEEQLREFVIKKVSKLESSATSVIDNGRVAVPSLPLEKIGFLRGTELLLPLLLEALDALEKTDQYLCEHIIDNCGYVPESYAIEDLVILVRDNSSDADIHLSKVRATLESISEKICAR